MPAPAPSYPHAASLRPERLKAFLAQRAAAIRWVSIAVMLAALAWLMRILPSEHALGWLRNGIDSLGIWGPLVLGALYVLATLLFIPGWLMTLASGALYGLALGTLIVSLSSTTGAALAFLIARYVAREPVCRAIGRSPRLTAVDEAIGEQGWKIVALLRLSPAVPFNLQNYLYGVTAIRFWPYVLVSWAAMLPGTFMYVYIGSLGNSVAAGRQTTSAEWALRGVGLLATVIVTIYVARLARNAIQQRTSIASARGSSEAHPRLDEQPHANDGELVDEPRCPCSALVMAMLAAASVVFAGWTCARQDTIRRAVEQWLGAPPTVTATDAHTAQRLPEQAAGHVEHVHTHPRWFRRDY